MIGACLEKSMNHINQEEGWGFWGSLFLFLEAVRRYFFRKTKIALLSLAFLSLATLLIGETMIPVRNAQAFEFSVTQEEDFSLCDLERELQLFGSPEKASASKECSLERDLFLIAKGKAEREDAAQTGSEDHMLTSEIASLTEGYPIEIMAPEIAKFDREIAALLVGIAKKESNWGKRVPRTADGSDCFNYWGFKGAGERGVAMGHGCFGTPEEAVEKVGNRLAELVALRETSDPARMTVWKCGSSCATHSPESVRKWISDVDHYYRMIVASR